MDAKLRVCSQLLKCIPDHGDVNEAEGDQVELVVAGGYAAEALEPAAEALDLVAPTVEVAVEGPGRIAVPGRRDDGPTAQFTGQLAGLVAVIGAVHDQRQVARDRAESGQELASDRRIAALTKCEADDQLGAVVGDQVVQLAAQTARVQARGTRRERPFAWRPCF